MYPKSYADIVERRYSPMFVGDVLCATLMPGRNWQLSGGSQLSPCPTNVSKNVHVFRAILRRKWCCASDSFVSAFLKGLLSHHATNGADPHSASTGVATN